MVDLRNETRFDYRYSITQTSTKLSGSYLQRTKSIGILLDSDNSSTILVMAASLVIGFAGPYLMQAGLNYSADFSVRTMGSLISYGWHILCTRCNGWNNDNIDDAKQKKNDDLVSHSENTQSLETDPLIEVVIVDKSQKSNLNLKPMLCYCPEAFINHMEGHPSNIMCPECLHVPFSAMLSGLTHGSKTGEDEQNSMSSLSSISLQSIGTPTTQEMIIDSIECDAEDIVERDLIAGATFLSKSIDEDHSIFVDDTKSEFSATSETSNTSITSENSSTSNSSDSSNISGWSWFNVNTSN